jgi:integrase
MSIFRHLRGVPVLMASLLYGSGLRLLECCRLRVQDIDFENGQITVRDGKGQMDRVTMLPVSIKEPLRAHLASMKAQHERDLKLGWGYVELPTALAPRATHAA